MRVGRLFAGGLLPESVEQQGVQGHHRKEDEGVAAEVWLSDLSKDPGEKVNLANELPELCEQLKAAALKWRAGIENTWEEKFAKN